MKPTEHRPRTSRTFVFCLRIIRLATAIMAISVACGVRAEAGLIGPVFDSFSDTDLYLVGTAGDSWSNAEAAAQAIGGTLVTIHSAAENQFISDTFFQDFTGMGGPDLTNAIALWLGLYDPTGIISDDGPGGTGSQHATDFVWADGENSAYRNWNSGGGEPNDANGGEYYGSMWGPGNGAAGNGNIPTGIWNDLPNTYPDTRYTTGFFGVAEVAPTVPEPASLVLLGAGLGFSVLFRVIRRPRPQA